MNRSELKKLRRRELYEMAKAYDLAGRSRMTKGELVESLSRVSAKKVVPKPKPPKRRMSKRRVRRRRVAVRTTAGRPREAAGGSKMEAPAPQPQRPQAYVDRGPELPGAYGQDKVLAMVRDPNWIYAYWDISGGARERVYAQAPDGAWVLRVHNVSESAFDDVPVLVESGNWYVPVASDTEYTVEIGLLGPDGRFHAAASSRPVRTPRMGISQLVDEHWMILEDEFQRLMEFSDGLAMRFSGSKFLSEVITGSRRLAGMHSAGVSSLGGSKRK